jgi:hypothetical protein
MMLVIMVYGPGRLSVDELLTRFNSSGTQLIAGQDALAREV